MLSHVEISFLFVDFRSKQALLSCLIYSLLKDLIDGSVSRCFTTSAAHFGPDRTQKAAFPELPLEALISNCFSIGDDHVFLVIGDYFAELH